MAIDDDFEPGVDNEKGYDESKECPSCDGDGCRECDFEGIIYDEPAQIS